METILCIPGHWSSRAQLVAAIAGANNMGAYIFAGQILLHIASSIGFTLELDEPDAELANAFRLGGQTTGIGEEVLAAVEAHRHIVYLIGETGSLAGARAIAEAATAVLRAGGVGVKVETAGKAFGKDAWLELLANPAPAALAGLFVIDAIQESEDRFFSCGMHNLGLKDTLIAGESAEEAVHLLAVFSRYQVVENPALAPGHTFSIKAEGPVFRLTEVSRQPYEGHELFENEFGMWEMTRL